MKQVSQLPASTPIEKGDRPVDVTRKLLHEIAARPDVWFDVTDDLVPQREGFDGHSYKYKGTVRNRVNMLWQEAGKWSMFQVEKVDDRIYVRFGEEEMIYESHR